MDGILVINKEKDYTSRDIVNIAEKHFQTKKIGHTGTLDPLATGVLVLCLGKALKIVDLITSYNKEYIARIILGIETDTLDIMGNVTKEEDYKELTNEEIKKILDSFRGKINQEVPKYSAVRLNGKKLYQYARENIEVTLPVREVEIYNIELIGDAKKIDNRLEFTIKCEVSKGTYIRSLIRDIGYKLNTCATMKELIRTRQGVFNIDQAITLEQLHNNNYNLISIREVLSNIDNIKVDDDLLFKIKNGQIIENIFNKKEILFLDKDNKEIALYKEKDGDPTKIRPWIMF